jgi:hypothetical protein
MQQVKSQEVNRQSWGNSGNSKWAEEHAQKKEKEKSSPGFFSTLGAILL